MWQDVCSMGKEVAVKGNILVFLCFAGGIAVGMAGVAPEWMLMPDVPKWLLSVLVVCVGLGIGSGDDLYRMLRSLNVRMFALPLFTIAGTLLFSVLGGLLLPQRSMNECLAVGSGFGYYSLSSVLIADLGSASLGQAAAVELATIALLANIVREMLSLFGTPLFSKWGGSVAPISVAGINSMDVCLPLIARYSGSEFVPQAILHGIALEVSVPLLIGAFC